jgi:hypothetical protein
MSDDLDSDDDDDMSPDGEMVGIPGNPKPRKPRPHGPTGKAVTK